MRKSLRSIQTISVLMIFVMLIQLTSCYTAKMVSTSEIETLDNCMIHCKNSSYRLENAVIYDEMISGKLDHKRDIKSKIHIYLVTDFNININNGLLKVPVGDISRIELYAYDRKKTAGLIGAIVLTSAAVGVMSLIMLGKAVSWAESVELCSSGGLH
jgi:hypothetical protein